MGSYALRRIAVLALVLSGCAPPPQQLGDPARQATFAAPVSRVFDGDTFALQGQSRRIRVWGLDAPEWNRPGGSYATATMRKLVAGKRLQCDQRDIDRYDRIVAQCFLPDGRDIAAVMMRAGAATEYCRYSRGHYGTC